MKKYFFLTLTLLVACLQMATAREMTVTSPNGRLVAVIDDDGMHAVVAEIFAHGAAGERRDVLHRRRIKSR